MGTLSRGKSPGNGGRCSVERIPRHFYTAELKGGGSGQVHHGGWAWDRRFESAAGVGPEVAQRAETAQAGKLVADTREVTEPGAGSKSELTHHRIYRARLDAIREITEHIEVFYSRQRRQPRLGVLSPAA